jgi:hypothetical protein
MRSGGIRINHESTKNENTKTDGLVVPSVFVLSSFVYAEAKAAFIWEIMSRADRWSHSTGSTSTSQPFDVGIPVPSVLPPMRRQVGGP